VDAKADTSDGFHVAVALEDIFHSDDGFGHKQELTSLQQTRFLRLPVAWFDRSVLR
jgi:hypothetical protein